MRILLLGTAAGGGVPQWNCNCDVCREARAGTGRVRTRTQSSVAISADGQFWFLLNASPDLRAQIESTTILQPPLDLIRGSPIEAVLLTNADLDHVLGLLLLRENRTLLVHAPAAVQQSLTNGLSVSTTLNSFCGIQWIEPPRDLTPLPKADRTSSGLSYQAVPLPGAPPRFHRTTQMSTSGNVVAYRIIDQRTGGQLLFAPDVSALEPKLVELLPACDALLFDGTFWSEDEMAERGVGTASAGSMGHVPISGTGGSLKVLAALKVKHKVYTHINNTNPILFEDSPERAALSAAGWVVGWDGMEITI
jgi:pyrroloquinoline quinone biosynthesis protein B